MIIRCQTYRQISGRLHQGYRQQRITHQQFRDISSDVHSTNAVVPMPRRRRNNTSWAEPFQIISTVGTLFKWKLSLWVALSTIPGFFMSGVSLSSPVFLPLVVGTFLCSGGANTFNQIIERDRDALMTRTRTRPLCTGRISPQVAYSVGTAASLAGVAILLAGTNPTTAILGALNIGSYALIYTPMKTSTPYSTHIGSIVGAIPTLMGCTAEGVSLSNPDPWMLFMIQTLWQFPHFYGLAWRYRQDYLRGGFISFPLSDTTGHLTAKMMKPYIIGAALLPFITTCLGITTVMFPIDGSLINYALWNAFSKFEKAPSIDTSRRFFGVSLWHLLVFLTLAVFHSRSLSQQKQRQPLCMAGGAVNESTLHQKINSLREVVQEFCVHKQFYDRDYCIFDKVFEFQSEGWPPTTEAFFIVLTTLLSLFLWGVKDRPSS